MCQGHTVFIINAIGTLVIGECPKHEEEMKNNTTRLFHISAKQENKTPTLNASAMSELFYGLWTIKTKLNKTKQKCPKIDILLCIQNPSYVLLHHFG